jgi:hypothetical protein
MAAAQTEAAHVRHAPETHPAAAETHPAASAAQMHSAASEVKTTTATAAEVSTATTAEVSAAASTAAAAEGLRSQWRHNGRQRRQQDCANHKSGIFHEYLPELHRV